MSGDEELAPASQQAGLAAQRLGVIADALKRISLDYTHDAYGCLSGINWDGDNINGIFLGLFIAATSVDIIRMLSLEQTLWIISPFILAFVITYIYRNIESWRLAHLQNTLLAVVQSRELIERMAQGVNSFPLIQDYSPRFWWFAFGRKPKTDIERTWLIADNLIWYLHSPRKLRFKDIPNNVKILVLLGYSSIIFALICLVAAAIHNPQWKSLISLVSIIVHTINNNHSIIEFAVFFAMLVIFWKSPLPKLYAQVLLSAVAKYQEEAQAPIPPPASSAPPAEPPSPPG